MNTSAPSRTILLAVNDLSFGGAQRTVVAEANRLSRMGQRVFVLTLLRGSALQETLTVPKENVLSIPFRGFADVRSFIRLVRLLRRLRPDVVISNLFFTNTLIRLAKLCCPKLRIFIREGNVPVEKSVLVKLTDVLLSFCTERIILNAAALERPFLRLCIPRRKLTVLYNGIDPNFFAPTGVTKGVARARFDVPESAFVIATVGSLTRKKGHEYLLHALAGLPENAHLLLAGEGPLRATLASTASSLNLTQRVHFAGTQQDVRAVFAAADVFALPSLWEGMPNALLEAMAAALAVVATDVGGVKEFLTHEVCGLLVPPAESDALARALRRLMEDSSLRSRLGEGAREAVRDLSWERHAQKLLLLIQGGCGM